MNTQEIERLHNEGYTQYEIARLTGYSQPAVSIALQGMGYKGWRMDFKSIKNPILKDFCLNNDMSIAGMAKVIGCSKEKASAFLYGDRDVRLSVEQFQRLLKAMGKTFEEVFG